MATGKKEKTPTFPVTPLGDKILVEMILNCQSSGGVYLPEKEGQSGIVRSIGLGVHTMYLDKGEENTQHNARGIKLGDKVCVPRGLNAGQQFSEGEGETKKVFVLVPVGNISAIVN